MSVDTFLRRLTRESARASLRLSACPACPRCKRYSGVKVQQQSYCPVIVFVCLYCVKSFTIDRPVRERELERRTRLEADGSFSRLARLADES
jgi:transposase-like protein